MDASRLRQLVALNRSIAESLDYHEVLDLIVAKTDEFMSADACALLLADANNRASVAASVGVDAERARDFAAPLDEAITSSLQTLLDFQHDDTFIGVPVVSRGQIRGVLAVFRRGTAAARPDEEYYLSALADQAAIALQNATLHRDTCGQVVALQQDFRALIEALPQLVYSVDSQSLPLYFNHRWMEYTGLGPGTLESRADHVHPEDRERLLERWSEATRTASSFQCEYRIRRRDGEYRWFMSRACPARDAAGKVLRWVGTDTDIHDLKQAHESLRDAEKRRDAFLAMLSHELRNPLAPIRCSLNILDRVVPGGEHAKRALAAIDRQVAHLTRLVDDLLDAVRMTTGRVKLRSEPVELGELVRRTVDDHRAIFAAKGVTLDVALPPSALWLEADAARLAQIVGNLLQNAAKFTPRDSRVELALQQGDGVAVLRLRDEGVGMTADVLGQIFQPFAQADTSLDRKGGGLGLGLVLVKGWIELHHGSIAVESDGIDCGTTFTVELPLVSAPAPEPHLPAAPPVTPRRVLVIEDNEDAAASLRDLLELDRHLVMVAHSGPEGIIRARAFEPEIVLCDIGLPGMDGYAVAQSFRLDDRLRKTFLVALSGYTLPEDLRKATVAGFDRHLAKPATPEMLRQVLAALDAADQREVVGAG